MSGAQNASNIRDRLLEAAGLSLDRLPMLHVIFDRMATYSADYLHHLASSPMYFSLSDIESGRIGDILDTYETRAIVGIFHVPEWDNHVLVGVDRDFVYSMIEVLLGSDGSEPPADDERSFSNIELRLTQAVFERMGKVLQESFSLVSSAQFKFERFETRMDFAVIGSRNNQSVVARFLLQALNRGGEMFVIIPRSALSPMRQVLSRVLTGESTARDPKWTKQITDEVKRTEVTLKAILDERHLTLDEITNLQVGHVISLNATPQSRVKLEGASQGLFWCQLGQSQGSYMLRVEDFIDEDQEFMNGVLSH